MKHSGFCFFFISAILFLVWGQVAGQYFSNPSFEGRAGIGISPPEWEPFDDYSTPDTEPLPCDIFIASQGDTYMTLVTRGPDNEHPGSQENAITELLRSLESGKYYKLSLDLASRDDLGHFSWEEGFVAYQSTVILKVFGSSVRYDKGNLLASSEAVTNSAWGTYTLYMNPLETVNYLILEAENAFGDREPANLLVDGIQIEEIDEPPIDFGELDIPNVFTPNGDGSNDLFMIRGLAKESHLSIYDRSGREVFQSDDYSQDWDGTDMNGRTLPEGTYWYVLFPEDLSDVLKGFVYLKRE